MLDRKLMYNLLITEYTTVPRLKKKVRLLRSDALWFGKNFIRFSEKYRGADKSLTRPDWKNNWKVAIFSSDVEVIAAAETWLDGQPSELFLSGLQKLEFGSCSLFPYWSG